MPGSEVGSAYVSIFPDTSHFQEQLEGELNGMNVAGSGQSVGQSLASGVERGFSPVTVMLGNLMSSAIEGAVNLFTSHLDRGIQRLDTIKNFPRLMATFGYSTDVAADSVENIQEHLMGLPGSTDEVLRLVQAISDSTGSLELATSTGLAFNDMLTASGADAYTSMMAMRMFDQMMGGAQFTTMRWMALVSKMPLQMNMVAESILGTGASAQELGTALQQGEVTMKDVAEAMTALAPQFTVQAKAFSYGVGTAVRNFGNRVVLGIAAILGAIGQFHISNVINGISTGIKNALVFVAGGVEWLRRVLLTSGIGVLLGEIGDKISEAFMSIDWEPVKEFLRNAIGGIHDALQWILDNWDLVKAVFMGIVTALGSMAVVDTIFNITESLFGAKGLFTLLAANPAIAIVGAITGIAAALAYFFTETETGREIWANFTGFIGDAIARIQAWWQQFSYTFAQNWGYLKNTLSQFWEGITSAVQTLVEVIVTAFTNLFQKISEIWNGIVEAIRSAWDAARSVFEAVRTAIEAVWNGILTTISNIVVNIVRKVTDSVNNVKKTVATTFQNVLSTVRDIWNGVKRAIEDPISRAKEAVRNAIEAIKGFFNFKFQWPHIPLPHFSISGSANPLDWITGGLPKIGVEWYAKGGFFKNASLIGVGERSTELAWPSNQPYFKYYARGIANEMQPVDSAINNYYIDGSLVSADARLSSALDVVAECVSGRRRMGVA